MGLRVYQFTEAGPDAGEWLESEDFEQFDQLLVLLQHCHVETNKAFGMGSVEDRLQKKLPYFCPL